MARKDGTDKSGPKIIRHTQPTRKTELTIGEEKAMEAICDHVAGHIGEAETVLHEIASDLVHIDVHIISPSDERDYWTLFTTGMSDRPMAAPEGAEECRFAELYIKLPRSWMKSPTEFDDKEKYWPFEWLKILARLPHEYDSWLWSGHTVPNGDPAEPFAPNTKLCCAMVCEADLPPLEMGEGKTAHFLVMTALYEDEVELKISDDEAFWGRFAGADIGDVLDIDRASVAVP